MKRNQESTFVEEQATRQEREENVEVYQSRVEETHPLQSGEISEMGEMWNEIRRLREQVGSRAPVPKKRGPFSLSILEEGLPPNFRQSNVGEYDGHTDPEEHLGRFENAAMLHQYSDGVRCRVFLRTLVRSAQQWFNTLQPNSIQSFEDFSAAFFHRFSSSKRHQKNYLSLFVMKQQEAETLREFVQRFNSAVLEIPAATPDIMISAFTQGLRGGEFFKSLVKKHPLSYDDWKTPNGIGGWKTDPEGVGSRETREEVIREVQGRQEGSSSRSELRSRPSSRRGRGPPWIHQRIEEPRREGRGHEVPWEPAEPRRGTNEDNHPTRGIIHMISGGAIDGDSGRARKAHGRRLENFEISRGADLPQDPVISFGPDDLRGIVAPHNDALVVTATVANYDVARIFIDNGSSVNILFKSTLDQMKVEGFEFEADLYSSIWIYRTCHPATRSDCPSSIFGT
ncbi:uncharacterized protein LOC142505554 [Primulina tabacum]|uniref:uncharacterized protein LOC142505554 n=1 Tax=Primulina tabacum TaxID=48773 RepID=UPI003F5A43A6